MCNINSESCGCNDCRTRNTTETCNDCDTFATRNDCDSCSDCDTCNSSRSCSDCDTFTTRNSTETRSGCNRIEQHVHEFLGSTVNVERCEECHNHRFATVSDVVIPTRESHVHRVQFRTDSTEGHFHEFCGTSSPAIWVGDGRHVHFLSACTRSANGHVHQFRAASLIDDPTEEC